MREYYIDYTEAHYYANSEKYSYKKFMANILNTILNILNDILFECTNSVVLFHLVRAQKSIATRNY